MVQRSVVVRAGLVVGAATVGVVGNIVCRFCAAIGITVVVCCGGVVAAEQVVGCIDVGSHVGSIMDGPRVSITACVRASCAKVGSLWEGSGWDVHASVSGSKPRNWSSGIRASVLHCT